MIVCVQTSNKEQQARALSASLPLSLPTKAVHTMVFQGTSAPSIPPSIHPARISSQPSRPETSSSPPKSATAAPDGNVESCLPFFSSTPTVLASAPRRDRSLRRASGGSLGTYLTVPCHDLSAGLLKVSHAARAEATFLHTRENSTEDDWTLDTFLDYGWEE